MNNHQDGMNIKLKKLSDNSWEIPKTGNMLVPAIAYASEKLLEKIKDRRSI